MTHLRLGIVGCGRVVEVFHLPALRRSARWSVQALADPLEERLTALHPMAPEASLWPDVETMIQRVPLDAVLIATPPEGHLRIVRAALAAGLNVLLEKPGGLAVDDAEDMAAAQGSQIAWVGFNRRFVPPYGQLKAWIVSQGPEASIRGRFDMVFSAEGWHPVSGYLGNVARGGSVRLDVVSHQLDLLPWLFDSALAEVSVEAWDDRPGPEGMITYWARLNSGANIRCLAAHEQGFTERIHLRADLSSSLAQPTGVLFAGARPMPSLESRAAVNDWVERKLIRLGMKPDYLAESYALQWEAFAKRIEGMESSIAGAQMRDLPRLHLQLAALERSAESGEPTAIPKIV